MMINHLILGYPGIPWLPCFSNEPLQHNTFLLRMHLPVGKDIFHITRTLTLWTHHLEGCSGCRLVTLMLLHIHQSSWVFMNLNRNEHAPATWKGRKEHPKHPKLIKKSRNQSLERFTYETTNQASCVHSVSEPSPASSTPWCARCLARSVLGALLFVKRSSGQDILNMLQKRIPYGKLR